MVKELNIHLNGTGPWYSYDLPKTKSDGAGSGEGKELQLPESVQPFEDDVARKIGVRSSLRSQSKKKPLPPLPSKRIYYK